MANSLTNDAASLTVLHDDGLGYEAKYSLSDRLHISEYHCHDFYEFYIHLRGGQYMGVDDQRYLMQPNQLFVIPPFSMHGISCERETQGYERAYLNLSPELIRVLGMEQMDLDQFIRGYTSRGLNTFQLTPEAARRCVGWIRQLEASHPADQSPENYRNYSILVSFMSTVCQTMLSTQQASLSVISSSVIQDVLTYINSNYTQPLRMEDMARRFGISVSYLSHEFKRFTSRSVYEYILYRRVMLARQMIQTDLALSTIAYQCGFNDYSNFLRMFTKLIGVSPSQYRRQLKPMQRIHTDVRR